MPLEKAGFIVERLPKHALVKCGKAKVSVIPDPEGDLMVVFSAPLIFWGKNLRLAKQVNRIFLQHGL